MARPIRHFDGIHGRMPVMLMPDDYDRWLDPSMTIDDQLRVMLKPYDAGLMTAYEVSRARQQREERQAGMR